jgi:hypothetical protein
MQLQAKAQGEGGVFSHLNVWVTYKFICTKGCNPPCKQVGGI